MEGVSSLNPAPLVSRTEAEDAGTSETRFDSMSSDGTHAGLLAPQTVCLVGLAPEDDEQHTGEGTPRLLTVEQGSAGASTAVDVESLHTFEGTDGSMEQMGGAATPGGSVEYSVEYVPDAKSSSIQRGGRNERGRA